MTTTERRPKKRGRDDEARKKRSSAEYARVSASALAATQRAQVLLKRAQAQAEAISALLETPRIPEEVYRSGGKFGPALSVREAQSAAQARALELAVTTKKKPEPLKFDELGRPIDADGNVVTSVRTAEAVSLLVNKKLDKDYVAAQKQSKREKFNPYTKSHFDVADGIDDDLVDPRLSTRRREHRKLNALNFIKEGTYVRIAEATRAKLAGVDIDYVEEEEEEKDEPGVPEEEEEEDEREPASALERAMADLPRRSPHFALVPGMEWWDEDFLDKATMEKRNESVANRFVDEYAKCAAEHSGFLALVHHPKTTKPLALPAPEPATMPFYLTKKDRRRVRRQARAERDREKRDKISLGLLPPPEPKFKLSNFMKVLGQQAVADPSKLEKKVMAQVKQRVQSHEMRNAARKLTPQERREKKKKKLQEDTSHDVHVAVFYVKNLDSPQRRFKLDVNAKQFNLTGGVLLCVSPEATFALVIAEGGPKGLRRFSALVTRRIDWSDGGQEDNWSALVWQGTVVKRAFSGFKFQECKTTFTARRLLEAKHVPHYWDMAIHRHEHGPPDQVSFSPDLLPLPPDLLGSGSLPPSKTGLATIDEEDDDDDVVMATEPPPPPPDPVMATEPPSSAS